MSTYATANPALIWMIRAYIPVLVATVVGLVVGALGTRLRSTRDIPAWLTILTAICGAFGGAAIAQLAGLPTWALLFQIVVAALGVVVVTSTCRRRFARH